MRNYKYDWENPAIFKKNKEDGHVIAFSYDNEQDALNRIEPKTKMTLNGTWKFHWQRGLNDCPTDFYKDSFDASFWRDITVPSVWQIGEEYGSYPYYYASTFCRAISRSKSKIPSIDHTMQEIGIYVRDFDMPENFDGQEIFLHFGAAKSARPLQASAHAHLRCAGNIHYRQCHTPGEVPKVLRNFPLHRRQSHL